MEVDEGAAAPTVEVPGDQGANAPGAASGAQRWGRFLRVGNRPLPPKTNFGVISAKNVDLTQEQPDLGNLDSFPSLDANVLGAKDS
eukprot:9674488-Alexandrium_andersonii.AAC.1